MHDPTDSITHTAVRDKPVVEHWLEQKNSSTMKDRSDDPSHHELHLAPKFVRKIMAFSLPAQLMFVGIEFLLPPNWVLFELINYVCQPFIEYPVLKMYGRFNHNRSGVFWYGSERDVALW